MRNSAARLFARVTVLLACSLPASVAQTVPPSSLPSGGSKAELSSEEIFSRFVSRILVLTCDLSAGDAMWASGVLISADGFVATNAHVVEGCRGRSITATQIIGTSRRSYSSVLQYYDKTSDTAVLRIEGRGLEFFSLPTRIVRNGERVYAIGNPKGLVQSISEGIVSGVRDQGGVSWIQHSAPISPGSSGGALISSRGELLGINAWSLKESQGLNFAVPSSTLFNAYRAAQALRGPSTPSGRPQRSPAATKAIAQPRRDPDLPAPPVIHDLPPMPAPPQIREVPAKLGDEFIQTARDYFFDLLKKLPNFTCHQVVTPYENQTEKPEWHAQDTLSFDLVYKDGDEKKINGKRLSAGSDGHLVSWSRDRFGTLLDEEFEAMLTSALAPSSSADFQLKGQQTINHRITRVYSFAVDKDHSSWRIQDGAQWAGIERRRPSTSR